MPPAFICVGATKTGYRLTTYGGADVLIGTTKLTPPEYQKDEEWSHLDMNQGPPAWGSTHHATTSMDWMWSRSCEGDWTARAAGAGSVRNGRQTRKGVFDEPHL